MNRPPIRLEESAAGCGTAVGAGWLGWFCGGFGSGGCGVGTGLGATFDSSSTDCKRGLLVSGGRSVTVASFERFVGKPAKRQGLIMHV